MARTTSVTRTLTAKVNLGHYESRDCAVSDTVELDEHDDRDAVVAALVRRLQRELELQVVQLESLALYDKKSGRNTFVDPRDESSIEQARRLLPDNVRRQRALREQLVLKNAQPEEARRTRRVESARRRRPRHD